MEKLAKISSLIFSKRVQLFAVTAGFLGALIMPVPVAAQMQATTPLTTVAQKKTMKCSNFFFLKSWGCYLPKEPKKVKDFLGLLHFAVDTLLKLVAYVAAGFIIYGGVKYMIAQGEPSALAEAKSTVVNAVIGLIIAIASVALVDFVSGAF